MLQNRFVTYVLLLGILCPVHSFARHFATCDAALSEVEVTENFIAYLNHLINEQVITTEQLRLLPTANPLKGLHNQSAQAVHENLIQTYLENKNLDQQRLRQWITSYLKQAEEKHKNRNETNKNTQIAFIKKMPFAPIKRGKFDSSRFMTSAKWVEFNYDFEMMTTKVTQYMWAEVMGDNPSHFRDGPKSITLQLKDKPVQLRPDNPVESMTWWSVLVFANKISEQHGLPLAYDLKDIEFKGHAEDGTLVPINKELAFKIMEEHLRDVHLSPGYRLPTLHETQFVLSDRGRSKNPTAFSMDMNDVTVHQVAWCQGNSQGSTQPVATLQPQTIDGHEFYDLYGNVLDWSSNIYKSIDSTDKEEVNYTSRVAFSGTYSNDANRIMRYLDVNQPISEQFDYVGIRLVRTLK